MRDRSAARRDAAGVLGPGQRGGLHPQPRADHDGRDALSRGPVRKRFRPRQRLVYVRGAGPASARRPGPGRWVAGRPAAEGRRVEVGGAEEAGGAVGGPPSPALVAAGPFVMNTGGDRAAYVDLRPAGSDPPLALDRSGRKRGVHEPVPGRIFVPLAAPAARDPSRTSLEGRASSAEGAYVASPTAARGHGSRLRRRSTRLRALPRNVTDGRSRPTGRTTPSKRIAVVMADGRGTRIATIARLSPNKAQHTTEVRGGVAHPDSGDVLP